MSEYNTEQKRALLELLKKNCDRAYSIDSIVDMLNDSLGSSAPGKSTVYRLMTKLVKDGRVKRFVKGQTRGFVYQIIKNDHCHYHLHLKCTECGRLLHLDEKTSDELLEKVARVQNFAVSEDDTVLFGRCAYCKS